MNANVEDFGLITDDSVVTKLNLLLVDSQLTLIRSLKVSAVGNVKHEVSWQQFRFNKNDFYLVCRTFSHKENHRNWYAEDGLEESLHLYREGLLLIEEVTLDGLQDYD